jgi:hypothetical protein
MDHKGGGGGGGILSYEQPREVTDWTVCFITNSA